MAHSSIKTKIDWDKFILPHLTLLLCLDNPTNDMVILDNITELNIQQGFIKTIKSDKRIPFLNFLVLGESYVGEDKVPRIYRTEELKKLYSKIFNYDLP